MVTRKTIALIDRLLAAWKEKMVEDERLGNLNAEYSAFLKRGLKI